MPYSRVEDLPDAVKKLGKLEQRQWQSAFNTSFKNYRKENDKKYDSAKTEEENRERYAFSTAWSVVKRSYGENEIPNVRSRYVPD